MGTDLNSAPQYSGRQDVSFTSVAEAEASQGAEGQPAPQGATPVAVERGDTISGLMAQQGLDWNNPEHRAQFLQDNPQFADRSGGRNPDLIWPGEVLYIRPAAPAGQGDPPPTNGTQVVSGPDAEGNYSYQNYVNGQPSGEQYTARPGQNGQPANSVTISEAGGEVRTDDNGAPLTGWVQAGDPTADGKQPYVYYVSGMPTTEKTLVAEGADAPVDPPQPATGNDAAGVPFTTNGWRITASSSQGVAQHYFVNGYQIDSNQVVNGRSDGPPPIIAPGTNAQLAAEEFSGEVTETVETADGTYQRVTTTYAKGVVTGTERGPEFK